MPKESTPLLRTKLYIPTRRQNQVLRPRLLTQLSEGLRFQHRLTFISARAGAGKTTLVSEWLHQQERLSVWLSLDARDNDPHMFFGYLVGALQQLEIPIRHTDLGEREIRELPPVEAVITDLINEITASAIPFILVLDDYHAIQNDWVHKAIGFLIEHQPPEMHLVIITRVDPPLQLTQLRARGQLTEIRDHDLRFTAAEVVEFLNDVMELNLPTEAVATIELRTEGWIAGLQMAAISAQGHKQDGDLSAFIATFGGTNRFILDYLTEEVLSQQPPVVQDFLIETSILEQMCGELCDAVRRGGTEMPDSQSILIELERTNLFVIPLDDERKWYRYHHLFADLLQSVLRQRRSAEQVRELHRRAGRWYQEADQLGEAMSHILAAQDFEHAAALIDENITSLVHLFSRDKAPLILSWIEMLPEEIKRTRPWIDVYRASMLALSLELEDIDAILDDVEKRVDPESPRAEELLGHVAAVRAYCANLRGNAEGAISMATIAKKHLPIERNPAARGIAALTLADTCFATDDMDGASQAFNEMLRVGEKTGQLLIIVPALCNLADILKVQGRLHQAEELYSRAYQWLAERNGLEGRVRCSFEFGMADLLREWNQLDAAREHAMTGIEYRRRMGGYKLIGDLPLMRVLQAQGDIEGALEALRKAEMAAQTLPFQLAYMVEFRTRRVIQWLAVGDVETASRWAEECRGGSEQEQIALARLRLAQGRASEAQGVLVEQQGRAEAGGRTGRLIEILALQAVALEAQGLSARAGEALSHALSLARSEGYRRIFLDLGQPLFELLERVAAGEISARYQPAEPTGSYVRELLGGFRQGKETRALIQPLSMAEALSDPLSGRELEVLALLAEGLSNKEIAGRLVVAPSTVKQHLKNICRKLEVHGRLQAVRRGQELKLL